jgi:eukaryotic-like serine/threonine-protein kinase
MIGETIGKYRIVARLGRGGIGTVYKAVDETLEREVAIKVLNPGLTESDLLKRFRAEAITLARLNHPNIATLYELGQHGDELLMVMEFVRGETFDKLSERVGPMPFERAAYLIAQVLDALGHAHRVGIVHRDMKPANLILSESGVVKVMDFGIARMVDTEQLTSDGYTMGTPGYMAPEHLMGNEVDGRADLYGVGVILFRMLTGHLPFKADTATAMVQKQIKELPTPLRQFRAELPVWCEQILDRALAKAREARYQTADEFRSALMLSAALAPATEVHSALAPGGVRDPDTTVAPDRMPLPFRPAATQGPAQEAVAPPPPAPPAPAVRAAPVFIPIAPKPSAPEYLAANPAAPSRPARAAGQPRAPKKSYAVLAVAVASVVAVGVLFVILRWPSVSDTSDAPARPPAPAVRSEPGPPTVIAPEGTPPPVPAPAPASAPAVASGPLRGAAGVEPESSPPPTPRSPAPELRPILPSMTFAPVRLVVLAEGKTSEQETSLQLTRDALELPEKAGTAAIKSVPYSSVIAIFYSRSREPQWVGPTGIALPIVKMDGGMFGFMRRDRDWVSVRTKDEFVMLRPDGPLVARVIEAIEARTGLTTVRVGKRGASDD